jgi:hypothetical protein
MYSETKIAVRKAFDISRTLFFMGSKRYGELLRITQRIQSPTATEINKFMEDSGVSKEDAIISLLKERYEKAAVEAGFTAKQGIAMLEYAAMLEELK